MKYGVICDVIFFISLWGLYNFFAAYLRSIGNSVIPLVFLAISSILNIILDLWFVLGFKMGVGGAALATVISQYVSGIGIMLYTLLCYKEVLVIFKISYLKKERINQIISFSLLTCIQQCLCLYACTGFWKCLFYIHCPELWC